MNEGKLNTESSTDNTQSEEGRIKRNVKDSVFTILFSQLKYVIELYKTLHPEDTDITEDDIQLVTLESVIASILYNDLGLVVRERVLILSEAQSIFSINITIRLLMYLAYTYKEYAARHNLNLYNTKPVKLPKPELYMVYTDKKHPVPDTLHLSDLFCDGPGDVELCVHVIQGKGTGSIIDQYVDFCNVADEQRKLYGYTRKAAAETIRICMEHNILYEFLEERRVEVLDIMSFLYSQEEVTRMQMMEARQEGRQEEREDNISAQIRALREIGLALPLIEKAIEKTFSLSQKSAAEKVKKYWELN